MSQSNQYMALPLWIKKETAISLQNQSVFGKDCINLNLSISFYSVCRIV